MNELDLIRNHFLGFRNDFFDNFRRVSTYPPYNIKENTLSVSGCKEKELQEDLMHKGISDRSFIKRFQLHKQIIVDNAALKDGLLKVSYHREIPEAEKPKTIKIKSN